MLDVDVDVDVETVRSSLSAESKAATKRKLRDSNIALLTPLTTRRMNNLAGAPASTASLKLFDDWTSFAVPAGLSICELCKAGYWAALFGWPRKLLACSRCKVLCGGFKFGACGESVYYSAMGVVTTAGLTHAHAVEKNSFLPEEVFVGPVCTSTLH